MKILVDTNLSPKWAETLGSAGFEAIHWSSVGDIRAADSTIRRWARSNGYVLLTHDLRLRRDSRGGEIYHPERDAAESAGRYT